MANVTISTSPKPMSLESFVEKQEASPDRIMDPLGDVDQKVVQDEIDANPQILANAVEDLV